MHRTKYTLFTAATSPFQFCIPNVSIFSRVLQPKSNWEKNVSMFFILLNYYYYYFFFLKAGREVLLFIMEKGKGDELKQIIILKRIKR